MNKYYAERAGRKIMCQKLKMPPAGNFLLENRIAMQIDSRLLSVQTNDVPGLCMHLCVREMGYRVGAGQSYAGLIGHCLALYALRDGHAGNFGVPVAQEIGVAWVWSLLT